jgi:molybdopterin-guanine dinucleotide biosynthesis protein A
MGGVDKASIEIGGVTLLERALAATMGAVEVVVVGEQVPTSRAVTWTREEPAGGGPAAGLLAALERFVRTPDVVAVLAVDMPKVNAGTIARLTWAAEAGTYDGAVLEDAEGRTQPLCAVYRTASLRRVRPHVPDDEHGLSMQRLLADLVLDRVPAIGSEARDIDTWEDLSDLDD